MEQMDWSAWVGRTRQREDVLEAAQAGRLAVTLDQPVPEPGSPLPALWHWAFFQDLTPTAALAADGHAARGDFLPPVDLPSRMWAGSRVTFHQPLIVGARVTCTSTIDNVAAKQGRSGALVFVTVRHDYEMDGTLALREEQDIVYREPSGRGGGAAKAAPTAEWRLAVDPSPVLLFRYSAVTFNGHRIHYDHPYATGAEGYPGLIVHGPLIATLMCQAFVQHHPSARLRRFAFRGQRPLFASQPFSAAGRLTASGQAEVWAADDRGLASAGEIEFDRGGR